MYTHIYFTNYFTLFFCLLLQVLGVGIVVAALIGFLESIAISKAFGNYSRKDNYFDLPKCMFLHVQNLFTQSITCKSP